MKKKTPFTIAPKKKIYRNRYYANELQKLYYKNYTSLKVMKIIQINGKIFHIHESEDLISSGKTLQTALQSQSNSHQNYNCLFCRNGQADSKIYMEIQETPNTKTIQKEK